MLVQGCTLNPIFRAGERASSIRRLLQACAAMKTLTSTLFRRAFCALPRDSGQGVPCATASVLLARRRGRSHGYCSRLSPPARSPGLHYALFTPNFWDFLKTRQHALLQVQGSILNLTEVESGLKVSAKIVLKKLLCYQTDKNNIKQTRIIFNGNNLPNVNFVDNINNYKIVCV